MGKSVVALIPARAGSKRLANKNIRVLAGHPVIAYTIAAARESGIFDAVIVSTDSPEYAEIARHYGAEVPFLRPPQMAGDLSPDIEWIEHALGELREQGREFDCFSLLRPTSPFRRSDTIQRAWQLFMSNTGADSLRAVEKCTEHPGKMWVVRGNRMHPLLPFGPKERPWHSTPYQALPEVYVQNASLEIAWCRVVEEYRTIAGETIIPFITEDVEGLDVNNPSDWDHAEALLEAGRAVLPEVTTPKFSNAV
jgi:CMP-N,N'-diacetyllegionaminic acid synthase